MLGSQNTPCLAFVDSSHGTGTPDHKPVTGYAIQVYGGVVSHASRTQKLVCTSSTESEFRGMSECCKEVLFIAKVLNDLEVPHFPFPVYGDNKGAIDAVHADGATAHTRHIELHLGFMRDYREQGNLEFNLIRGVNKPADIFTKALSREPFLRCRAGLGMVDVTAM
jgi:hypothetical protein